MKNLMIKISTMLAMVALLALVFGISSCKEDEEEPPIIVLDGYYVKGASTALPDFSDKGMMKVARNEVTQEDRAELLEIYIAVKAGSSGFSIVKVAGDADTTYGPGADFAVVPEADRDVDEPKVDFWRGSYVESTTVFTVPADGLYHITLDKSLKKIAIAPVVWGVIGGATPGGWSASTPMAATFDLNKMEFAVEDVVMLKNEWKFRYSDGWKIIFDTEYDNGGGKLGIKVNTNFGGAVDALVPGGGNFANTVYAKYKITLTWELGKAYVATADSTGAAPPLAEYPETLYMIGATVGGWDWSLIDLPMVPVHSHPELFWKIVWMENGVADAGFKFAPEREWVGDFGKTGDPTNGVWAKGSDNVPEPATSGYYMVVVDLENETIEVNAPTVYLIGDAAGSWDIGVPANLFTVDNANELVTITKDLSAGNLRIYAAATTLAADWWQAEFMILNGKIEFRGTGGDQTAVPVTAGTHTVDLNFKTGDGAIN